MSRLTTAGQLPSPFNRVLAIVLIIFLTLTASLLATRTLWANATTSFSAGNESELVSALNGVNAAGSGTHSINLTADITLTAPLPVLSNPAADAITLEGDGYTVTGDGTHTVLAIAPGTTAVIDKLTITGGVGSNGQAGNGGGGIFNRGILRINESVLSGNSAGLGGAILTEAGEGAIASTTVYSSTLSNNMAESGGALASFTTGGEAQQNLDRTTVEANTAAKHGGGLYAAAVQGGTVTTSIARSVIGNNESGASGGGLSISATGGSLAKVTIGRAQFVANSTAGPGGGLSVSTDSDGRSDLFINRSTFARNEAEDGGGALAQVSLGLKSVVVATNLTLSGNDGGPFGGAIANEAAAGEATVDLTSATLAGNSAANGNGLYVAASGGQATIVIAASIISGSGADCSQAGGTFVSSGFNISSDDTCNLTTPTDLNNTDPQLQPLALNAPGETPTHALAAGSPAVDRVTISYNGCDVATPIDQRGAARPQGIKCDSGAYELDQADLVCAPPYGAVSDDTLNKAILCVNASGPGSHTININGPITLEGPTNPIDNTQATEIIVDGNSNTIDGHGRGTIFTVADSTAAVRMGDLVAVNGLGSGGLNQDSGGAFYVRGGLSLDQVTISNNRAVNGGGVFVDGEPSNVSLNMRNVSMTGNDATKVGGGLAVSGNSGEATVTMESTMISGNTAGETGGGINLSGYVGSASVTLLNTTLADNSASIGAGAFVNGNGSSSIVRLNLDRSTVSGNRAASAGGAVAANGNGGTAEVFMINSTISANSAKSLGGALLNSGNGGTAIIEARYSTFAENTAPTASLLQSRPNATAIFTASILDGPNEKPLCAITGGSVASGDYNVAQDESCQLIEPNDRVDDTLDLDPLKLNAPGTTRTHALSEGSPALDHIPSGNVDCGSAVNVDQRGESRPQPRAGKCDSGAYELIQGPPPAESAAVLLPIIAR